MTHIAAVITHSSLGFVKIFLMETERKTLLLSLGFVALSRSILELMKGPLFVHVRIGRGPLPFTLAASRVWSWPRPHQFNPVSSPYCLASPAWPPQTHGICCTALPRRMSAAVSEMTSGFLQRHHAHPPSVC